MGKTKLEYLDPNFKKPELNGSKYNFLEITEMPFQINGLPWFDKEKKFCRLPEKILPDTNEGVQNLAWHTSGVSIRFKTDSTSIAVRAELIDAEIMPHMPIAGRSGFDLYLGHGASKIFFKNARPDVGKATVKAPLAENLEGGTKECTVYLPLYNGIKNMQIGISPEAKISAPLDFAVENPVIFYGSSITQGGCASRPGNSYTNILTRWLDAPSVNMGFSGSGKGETVIAKAIAEANPSVFVMDYDHNAPTVEYLEKTHEKFFSAFRQIQSSTPVIFVSKCDFHGAENDIIRRNIIRKTWENAVNAGDRNVYFVDGETLFGEKDRDACTVDRCHPNDLGFMRMAEVLYPTLKKALCL